MPLASFSEEDAGLRPGDPGRRPAEWSMCVSYLMISIAAPGAGAVAEAGGLGRPRQNDEYNTTSSDIFFSFAPPPMPCYCCRIRRTDREIRQHGE